MHFAEIRAIFGSSLNLSLRAIAQELRIGGDRGAGEGGG
jgi:hypothetical protein